MRMGVHCFEIMKFVSDRYSCLLLAVILQLCIFSVESFVHSVVGSIPSRLHPETFISATTSPFSNKRRALTAMKMKGAVYIATSLDGYIAGPDGDIDWLNNQPPPTQDEGDMGFAAFLSSVDVMIMGRNTFDKVISFGKEMWAYGNLKIIVWSRTMKLDDIPDYRRQTVTCSSLSPKDLFAQLETEGCQKAYIDGGTTVQQFLKAGLVDEICLSQIPILLGKGIKLFPDDGPQIHLQLKESKSFSNGAVQSTYETTKLAK